MAQKNNGNWGHMMNRYAKGLILIFGTWLSLSTANATPATAEIAIDVQFEINVLNGPGTVLLSPLPNGIETTTASGAASSDAYAFPIIVGDASQNGGLLCNSFLVSCGPGGAAGASATATDGMASATATIPSMSFVVELTGVADITILRSDIASLMQSEDPGSDPMGIALTDITVRGFTTDIEALTSFSLGDGDQINIIGLEAGVYNFTWLGLTVEASASRELPPDSTPVPLPGVIWLFGLGVLGLGAFSNRKKSFH